MVSQRIVAGLLAGLAILIVSFSVLMGFALLTSALGDTAVARVLRWVGGGCGLLMVVDLILLVVALAVRSIYPGE